MISEVVVTVAVTLIVGDLARSSRWSAARVARWAAGRVYIGDRERAARRAEEWEGLVSDTVPSDVSAFCVGMSLGLFAVACVARRRVAGMASWCDQAYKRVSGWPITGNGAAGYLLDDHRQASLALLAAAHELRLCLVDDARPGHGGTRGRLPTIQRLATDTQLRAANVALLGTGTLGEHARKLGSAAADLADEASRTGGTACQEASGPGLRRLDRSIRAFQRCAAAVSEDLIASPAAGLAEPAGCAGNGS